MLEYEFFDFLKQSNEIKVVAETNIGRLTIYSYPSELFYIITREDKLLTDISFDGASGLLKN